MSLSAEQLEERRQYLGGTDMAAIAGLSRYARPIDVWLDKRGEAPARPASPMMALGSLLEPVVAQLFSTATGVPVRRPAAAVRDRLRPYLGGHLDRYAGPDGVLECKWAELGRRAEWGESGSSRVPPGHAVQLQHYLGITGRPRGYLAVLLGYADFRWYELARDEEVIEQLRELGRRFWTENVEAGVPPEPDGSESYGSYLRRRYAPAGALEVVANAEQQVLWAQYLAAHELQLAAGERLERAAQRLMESMGTATKLLFGAGHVSWAPYEERRTDWRATAGELAGDLEEELLELELGPDMRAEALLAHRAAKHTTTSTKRPFRPHPPKDEE